MRPKKAIGGVMMALGFVFALAGVAAAQDVKVDYDHSVDFSKYKTFWIQIKTTWATPFAEKRALEEITKALTAKGWKQGDEATARAWGGTPPQRAPRACPSGAPGYQPYLGTACPLGRSGDLKGSQPLSTDDADPRGVLSGKPDTDRRRDRVREASRGP